MLETIFDSAADLIVEHGWTRDGHTLSGPYTVHGAIRDACKDIVPDQSACIATYLDACAAFTLPFGVKAMTAVHDHDEAVTVLRRNAERIRLEGK